MFGEQREISEKLKPIDRRLKTLEGHISNAEKYLKYREVYGKYRRQPPEKAGGVLRSVPHGADPLRSRRTLS